jgi:FAD:protein FMN transferase
VTQNLYPVRFRAMGSPCQIRLFAQSLGEAQALAAPLVDEAVRLERRYSRYLPDSLVSRLNAGERLQLDTEAVGLFNYAAQLFVQSDGMFDITSGLLRKAWDFTTGHCPEPSEVAALLECIGWQKVHWQAPYLCLPAGMQVDLGGIVKEYAADALATRALQLGIDRGLVELGGDISVIGEGHWPVGISNPQAPLQPLLQLYLERGGFASSGNYQRYMLVKGKRYSHILNPKTGWPVDTPAGVSVIADSCLLAGSLSTLAMLMGERQCVSWLEDMGLPFLCVLNNGQVVNRF